MSSEEIQNGILVFTRMPSDGFDDFINDPEVVLATVEDMGFDKDEMLAAMSGNDPSQLYQLMEERWSGEGRNFSFESYWNNLVAKFPEDDVFSQILSAGRHTQINTDHAEIRVLTQDQVMRFNRELHDLILKNLDLSDEVDQMLESLFPALQNFFSLASEANEFVLVSWI